ncbi:hypothetical protein UA08_03337 [Talaromyces atroroseus]|uniref:Uncharacterized protein n=1 Tax=Talaromyces atroroseus TaxID=1441469 RepID=A0A225APS1_TALAT|nr:hypothetical protein UA08_03337 [Talaromyces atroroseus]OKL61493.1 hypothetical protein UA08_03337 [Talaromyces atroroseus]
MPFRERVKRAFRRSSDNPKNSKPKVEYYRRGECPRSKYRGPVDPEHRRKLYDWTFAAATADRRRSFDLDLSPCTSLPDSPQHDDSDNVVHEDAVPEPEVARGPHIQIMGSITVAHHEEAPSGSFDTSSDQSTAVMSSCRSSSLTLKDSWDWPATRRGAVSPLKQSPSFTSQEKRRISAPEKRLPFDPQDLRSALTAVRLVS